jgi:pSer/pThr/pTyr-binding forkhead associated (FHA) protein
MPPPRKPAPEGAASGSRRRPRGDVPLEKTFVPPSTSHPARGEEGTSPQRPSLTRHAEQTQAAEGGAPDEPAQGSQGFEAPPGPVTGEGAVSGGSYRTGSEYEAADSDQARYGEGSLSGEEDIYGESESYSSEDDEGLIGPEEPRSVSSETRIAPLERLAEEAAREEDEDPEEATHHSGPPIRLEVIAGPDTHKRKRFNGVRMVVGRVPDCDFILADQSVSRRHLELVHTEKGVLLRDLGSGNGSKVNGEKTAERVLQHGDEISIGKTRFRFVDEVVGLRLKEEAQAKAKADQEAREAEEKAKAEAEAAASAKAAASPGQEARKTDERPAPPRRRRRLKWSELEAWQRALVPAAGAVFFLLVMVIVVLARKSPSLPPEPDPKEGRAAEKMQLARNAVREEKFDQAVELIDEAERLKAGSDATGLRAIAEQEARTQRAIDYVRTLADDGKLEEAAQALSGLPEPTTEKRPEAIVELKRMVNARKAEAMANGVEGALAQKDVEQAKDLMAKLPADQQAQLAPKVQQAEEAVAEEKKAGQRLEAVARDAAKKRSKSEREAMMEEAFAGVARKFNGGEFARAVLECDRVAEELRGDAEVRQRAVELKRLIPAFQRTYEDGQKKYKAGTLEASARPLHKAKDLYDEIRLRGALGQIIDEELAASALGAGKAAQARGDLGSAAIDYREALRLNPNEDGAKEGLQRVTQAAEDMYLEAYMVRDRDPREAVTKLRIVLEVAPAGSTLHDKAQRQLQELTPE